MKPQEVQIQSWAVSVSTGIAAQLTPPIPRRPVGSTSAQGLEGVQPYPPAAGREVTTRVSVGLGLPAAISDIQAPGCTTRSTRGRVPSAPMSQTQPGTVAPWP